MGRCRVISYDDTPFRDRNEAGRLLSRELQAYSGPDTVVLGIPRGGVVMAQILANAIGARMDIVLSRKLGAPGNPELAIGAVGEDGRVFLNREIASWTAADDDYILEEKRRQFEEIARRIARYRAVRPKASLEGRRVIVTDDGVATGATMQAALWAARRESPKLLVAALPVGPKDTIERLARDADELVCLRVPHFFQAVGQFYDRFDQIDDDEVLRILEEEARRDASLRQAETA